MPSYINTKALVSELEKLAQQAKNPRKGLEAMAESIQKRSFGSVPYDRGDLRESWATENISTYSLLAGYNIPYAMYQHQGRRADGTHIIQNRPAGGESFFLLKSIERYASEHVEAFARGTAKILNW